MQTVETLKRQIKTAGDLHSVIKTMKTLAAVNIRLYEEAITALSDYAGTIQRGLQIVLRNNPQARVVAWSGDHATTGSPDHATTARDRFGVIVFGSDQGMCGQLNDQVVEFARATLGAMNIPATDLLVMAAGVRAAARLEESGFRVGAWSETTPQRATTPQLGSMILGPAVPAGLEGITTAVQEILLTLDEWTSRRQVNHVLLFFSRHRNSAFLEPYCERLLPVDAPWLQRIREEPWPTRILPTFTMDADRLFSTLIRQHLFIALYRGFAESLASENASRLASMQGAERNVEERLGQLQGHFNQERQMAVTGELLDIIAGFESLPG